MNYITKFDTFGWKGAFRGMRNPLNSWSKGDSDFNKENEFLGPNDLDLAKRLIKAGPEHRKFLRMIHVQLDINFPRYIWSEFDTYHNNTKNSCSTMHKLFSKDKPINDDMFLYSPDEKPVIDLLIKQLENLRKDYLNSGPENKNSILERAKQILPEGFLQLRTVDTNYEELRNIYQQRKNHKLKVWRDFCKELEFLPYFKEFISSEE